MIATLRKSVAIIGAASAAIAGGPCAEGSSHPTTVSVSILPQRQFVQRIADGLVQVEVLVLPGQAPATYEPTPRQMARLAQADVWVRIGVPFEQSVLRNLADVAPNLRTIDGAEGIPLVSMDEPSFPAGSTPSAGHDHLLDPHFWLDPLLVKIHARTVAAALCDLMPANCDLLQSNLQAFSSDLDAVHQRISGILRPVAGRDLFVFHPAFGYLCRRYGLHQVAVESGGKQPTARRLAALTEAAHASGSGALFVQPQFAGGGARAVADAIGVELVELDPLAADYIANLETMAERIVAAYRE